MKLNKRHRIELLELLDAAKKELGLIDDSIKEKRLTSPVSAKAWEVKSWLLSEVTIPALEKAIVDDELFNF